jgi:hypothetical protein
MKVYCLFEVIPYEGDYLIDIFFSEEGAKAELERMKLGNGERDSDNYTIAEWKVR